MEYGGWWKSALLGTVIGMLAAIGGIYLIEDALSYYRHPIKEHQPEIYTNGHPAPGDVPLQIANSAIDMQADSRVKR